MKDSLNRKNFDKERRKMYIPFTDFSVKYHLIFYWSNSIFIFHGTLYPVKNAILLVCSISFLFISAARQGKSRIKFSWPWIWLRQHWECWAGTAYIRYCFLTPLNFYTSPVNIISWWTVGLKVLISIRYLRNTIWIK